jgi:lysophospholipase L1-like esterase
VRRYVFTAFLLSVASLTAGSGFAQQPPFIGMGDSLGEGVQSDNASTVSQPHDYLFLAAHQLGAGFSLPLIESGPVGEAGSTTDRTRISPTTPPANLAVSGAATQDVLTSVATSGGTQEIDLVLPPYYGLSQLQIAQQLKPKTIFCWIGANDLIGYILDSDSLNNPTYTPFPQFKAEYQQLVDGLKATGAQVVLGNIPDLTEVAYVADNAVVQRYAGSQYSLPDGYYTTMSTVFLLKLGVFGQAELSNPKYVLSPAQITHIKNQVNLYNAAISSIAAAAGFPVADIHAFQQGIIDNPITLEGYTITTTYNGGAFSLDGIHPSDIGYAFFTDVFINAYNSAYNQSVPTLSVADLTGILNNDPFIDWNGGGVVRGRPGTGLLESEGPLLGISGDAGNLPPSGSAAAFMQIYFTAKGMDPQTAWTKADVINAVADMLHVRQPAAQ